MVRECTLLALVGVVAGTRHVMQWRASRRDRMQAPDPLESWEAEGGAVPVAPGRMAAQVSPRPVST